MNKLWVSNPNSLSSTILMSGLKIFSPQWTWSENSDDADLWAIDAKVDDIEMIARAYHDCPDPKPKVIYLAEQFTPMPVSHWVYFKSPINIRVFHKWLASNHFVPALVKENAVAQPVGAKPKWQRYRFKLSYWPNITQYAEGADIMMVCSMMMHNWCEYSQLIPFAIEEEILAKLLDDADKEGNLQYESQPIEIDAPEDTSESTEVADSISLGIFKKLFGRFRK